MEKENGCTPNGDRIAMPRRALAFVQRNASESESAPSPWQQRAKVLQQGVAAASRAVSPVDAERTRANIVKAQPGLDSTIYGLSRAATTSFYAHHIAAISSAASS